MSEKIGAYSLDESFRECISLRLSPGSSPVPWALCSLTATFMGECCGELIPKIDGNGGPLNRNEIAGAVDFVLNELVENAVKFRQHGNVDVTVGLEREDVVCLVSNSIMTSTVPALRAKLYELTQGDPGELLRRQVEANTTDVKDGKSAGSGLGYFILMNDHGVRLGWELSPISDSSFSITTMARIPVRNERSVYGN
jgi:hypothetical protein